MCAILRGLANGQARLTSLFWVHCLWSVVEGRLTAPRGGLEMAWDGLGGWCPTLGHLGSSLFAVASGTATLYHNFVGMPSSAGTGRGCRSRN